jgi:hypothetical protein
VSVSEPRTTGSAPGDLDGDTYETFLAAVRARFTAACESLGKRPALFVTAAPDLFEVFLGALPAALRQANTCATCKTFLGRYGGLVSVDADGDTTPALWDPAAVPEPYTAAVRAVAAAVAEAPIDRVFLSGDAIWAAPERGGWTPVA